MREIRTPGSVRGAEGNFCPYRDEAPMKTGALQGVQVPYVKGIAIRTASSHGGDSVSCHRKR